LHVDLSKCWVQFVQRFELTRPLTFTLLELQGMWKG